MWLAEIILLDSHSLSLYVQTAQTGALPVSLLALLCLIDDLVGNLLRTEANDKPYLSVTLGHTLLCKK